MKIERNNNGELMIDGSVIGFDTTNMTDDQLYDTCQRYNLTSHSWVVCDLAGTCSHRWGANDTVAQALGVDSKTISSYKKVFEIFPPSERLPMPVSFSAHRKAVIGKLDDRLCRVIFRTGINQGFITADAMEKHAKKAKEIAIANGYYNAPISDKEVDAFSQALNNEVHLSLPAAVKGGEALRDALIHQIDAFVERLSNVLDEKGYDIEDITFVGEISLNMSIPEDLSESIVEVEKPELIKITDDDVTDFEAALNQIGKVAKKQDITTTISLNGGPEIELDFDKAQAFLDRLERDSDRLLPKRQYDEQTGELIGE